MNNTTHDSTETREQDNLEKVRCLSAQLFRRVHDLVTQGELLIVTDPEIKNILEALKAVEQETPFAQKEEFYFTVNLKKQLLSQQQAIFGTGAISIDFAAIQYEILEFLQQTGEAIIQTINLASYKCWGLSSMQLKIPHTMREFETPASATQYLEPMTLEKAQEIAILVIAEDKNFMDRIEDFLNVQQSTGGSYQDVPFELWFPLMTKVTNSFTELAGHLKAKSSVEHIEHIHKKVVEIRNLASEYSNTILSSHSENIEDENYSYTADISANNFDNSSLNFAEENLSFNTMHTSPWDGGMSNNDIRIFQENATQFFSNQNQEDTTRIQVVAAYAMNR